MSLREDLARIWNDPEISMGAKSMWMVIELVVNKQTHEAILTTATIKKRLKISKDDTFDRYRDELHALGLIDWRLSPSNKGGFVCRYTVNYRKSDHPVPPKKGGVVIPPKKGVSTRTKEEEYQQAREKAGVLVLLADKETACELLDELPKGISPTAWLLYGKGGLKKGIIRPRDDEDAAYCRL